MRPKLVALFLIVFVAGVVAACGSGGDVTQQTGLTGAETKASTRTSTTSTGRARTSTSTQTATISTSKDEPPQAAQIKEQLIGNSIVDPHLGEWTFEDESEFVDFTIVNQKVSGNTVNYTVDVRLKDIGDGLLYNGELKITYTWMDDEWVLTDVSGEYRSGGPSI